MTVVIENTGEPARGDCPFTVELRNGQRRQGHQKVEPGVSTAIRRDEIDRVTISCDGGGRNCRGSYKLRVDNVAATGSLDWAKFSLACGSGPFTIWDDFDAKTVAVEARNTGDPADTCPFTIRMLNGGQLVDSVEVLPGQTERIRDPDVTDVTVECGAPPGASGTCKGEFRIKPRS